MSWFTEGQINMGGGNSGAANTAQLTKLISAFEELNAKLSNHINASVNTTTDDNKQWVHGIKTYINEIKSSLESALNTKADSSKIGTQSLAKIDGRVYDNIIDAINGINQYLSSFVKTTALNNYAAKDEIPDVSGLAKKSEIPDVSRLAKKQDVENLKESLNDKSKPFVKLLADTIEAVDKFIGRLDAQVLIDFTKWHLLAPQYAGTGSKLDTDTNGLYVIGELSSIWDDDTCEMIKAGRCFIKYVNSHPFDAIIDMTATKLGENKYTGSIEAMLSKGNKEWQNLKFHLCHATDSKGKDHIYLCMSADGLAYSRTDFTKFQLYVAGVNFIPLRYKVDERYTQAISDGVAVTAAFDKDWEGGTAYSGGAFDKLAVVQLATDKILTADKTELIHITRTIDDYNVEHKHVFIGHETVEEINFINRPALYVSHGNDELGNPIYKRTAFVTVNDITPNMIVPVGSVLLWPVYDTDEEGNDHLKNVPDGFIDVNEGPVTLPGADYPELAEIFNLTESDDIKLPHHSYGIVRVKPFNFLKEDVEHDKLLTLDEVNVLVKDTVRRLKAEVKRSTEQDEIHTRDITAENARAVEAETTLQSNIDTENARAVEAETTLQSNINAENARAVEAETTLQSNINAENARAVEAETTLQSNIDAENARAVEAETTLQSNIDTENARAVEAEASLSTDATNLKEFAEQLNKQSVMVFVGNVSALPTKTPVPVTGAIIANGQQVLLNINGTYKVYSAKVLDNNVTWTAL